MSIIPTIVVTEQRPNAYTDGHHWHPIASFESREDAQRFRETINGLTGYMGRMRMSRIEEVDHAPAP